MKSFILTVSGRVQGVYFRATARKKAKFHNINGQVKNLSNGTVQLVISGLEQDIYKFIEWCLDGSASANVHQLSIVQIEPQDFEEFKVVR